MNRPHAGGAPPPLRLISIAWGESYIKDYLEYCLPAILAPGNLSALLPHFSCEVVLVTESGYFERVKAHASYQAAARLCPVKLIALDDLIATRGSYGMSITYAFFRGFQDLGERMTDCVMVFLHADFIVAQHSLASLIPHLQRGERLIFAPSYCTIAENAKPVLRTLREAQVLAVDKRAMADLILRNRHYTVRAKTINQRFFHLPYMEQFYWAVDESTLLGYQLPIAVVAMKPERHLEDLTAYWDYGVIAEFCPSMKFAVLGDSDEYLMLELRDADTAKNQLQLGWMTPAAMAKVTAPIITEYTKKVGSNQLTLHSKDLPADIDSHRAQLARFLKSVYALLPDKLLSHLDHPQWTYHYGKFHRARARALAGELPAGGSSAAALHLSSFSGDPELLDRVDALASSLVRRAAERNDPRLRDLLATAERMRTVIDGKYAYYDPSLIKVRSPADSKPSVAAEPAGLATRISRFIFGTAPRYRPWHWMHSRSRLAASLAERHVSPQSRLLFLSSDTSVLGSLVPRAQSSLWATIDVIDAPELLHARLGAAGPFDRCVVEGDLGDLKKLRRIFETVRPLMTEQGRFIAAFFNNAGRRLVQDPDLIWNAFPPCGPGRLAYTGSWASVAALRLWIAVFKPLEPVLGFSAAYACSLLATAPLAFLSSLLERNRTMDNSLNPGRWVTAVTIDIQVG